MRTLVILLFIFTSAWCGDLVVVAAKNSKIEQLSTHQLRDLYLKRKQFIADKKVLAVNLPASNPARSLFDRTVLKMDGDELSEHWNERHYNGINPPMVQNSFDGIKAFVKKVDGAIGYIDSDSMDSGLKIIATIKQ